MQKKQGLSWINDPSNDQLRFDRNFIRHQILTPLRARWPSISQTLSRSSRHCSESSTLNAFLAEQDLQAVHDQNQFTDNILPLKNGVEHARGKTTQCYTGLVKKIGIPNTHNGTIK